MSLEWTLPITIDPTDTICVQIQVPNDINHISAFWGALEALNKAWNWQYTDDHKGSQTARVWQRYIDEASEQVRLGENCIVAFDCDDVEICLLSSPTIAAINAAIAQNSANIATNTGNISTNTNNITNLQGRMTSAESAIAQHTLDIAQNSADIALHTTQISDNANQVISLQGQVNSNDAELSNHETRISALEAGGGGGGGTNTKYTVYDNKVLIDQTNSTTTWLTIAKSLHSHKFTYSNAMINIFFLSKGTGTATEGDFRLNVNNNSGIEAAWIRGVSVDPISMTDTFTNIDTSQPVNVYAELRRSSVGGGVVIVKEQTIFISIIEYQTVAAPHEIVTFDAGGGTYQLSANNVGYIGSGGDPLNCLRYENTALFDEIGIVIDLGAAYDLDELNLDILSNFWQGVNIQLWVDATFISGGLGTVDNLWEHMTRDISGNNGQIIWVIMKSSASNVNLRMDNILISVV